MRQQSRETRKRIFEACSRILRREGFSNLTLAAVADEGGLSKGGLLYHFPSKKELIEGLFEYHNERFEQRLAELAEAEADAPGAWLRAYAKASIEQIVDPDNVSLYASLFAAEERYDSAHRLMREKYEDWQQKVEESGLDPLTATFVRLTVDGLWFAELHRYAPPDPERREQIMSLVLEMTHPTTPPAES